MQTKVSTTPLTPPPVGVAPSIPVLSRVSASSPVMSTLSLSGSSSSTTTLTTPPLFQISPSASLLSRPASGSTSVVTSFPYISPLPSLPLTPTHPITLPAAPTVPVPSLNANIPSFISKQQPTKMRMRTEPWGSPESTSAHSDASPLRTTLCFLSLSQTLIHSRSCHPAPASCTSSAASHVAPC